MHGRWGFGYLSGGLSQKVRLEVAVSRSCYGTITVAGIVVKDEPLNSRPMTWNLSVHLISTPPAVTEESTQINLSRNLAKFLLS